MYADFNKKYRSKPIIVSRCGYTGEDGFEVSVPHSEIEQFMDDLLSHQIGELVGLGARDSLRLEAGLCLYGHDINDTLSPIEGALAWTISKRRREQGGFLGFSVVKKHLDEGVAKKRVGFVAEGKLPVREGSEIFNKNGEKVGIVTSGGPSPCLKN